MDKYGSLKQNDVRKPVFDALIGCFRKCSAKRLLLCVSTGADSVCLLHSIIKLRDELDLELCVAHVNHGLREESDEEEAYIRQLCRIYNLPLEIKTLDGNYKRLKQNIENWARTQRYKFFYEVLEKNGLDWIVTAHHKNDLAETLLFRMLSGRALLDFSTITYIHSSAKLLRPLLCVEKDQLYNYNLHYDLKFYEDITNNDLERTRNKIRKNLLPLLSDDYNPKILDVLSELSHKLNEDEGFLKSQAKQQFLIYQKIGLEQMKCIPKSLRWRVISEDLQNQLGGEAGKIGYNKLKLVEEAILSQEQMVKHKKIELGFGFYVEVVGKKAIKAYRNDNK